MPPETVNARLTYMQQALAQAEKAAAAGEVPVGAVLVDGDSGAVLAAAHNRVDSDHDPTAHAEMLVIRAVARDRGEKRLAACDLYVTLEPCPMCAQAISFARLRRVYYTAFSPIPHGDGRLPAVQPPLLREHRLYQCDWLMRFYGFSAGELTSQERPNLDLAIDPKLAWALANRAFFPVNVNRDPLERLLRVPGLGQRTAKRLLTLRRHHAARLDDLAALGVPMRKIRPWVLTADWNPATALLDLDDLRGRVAPPAERQLELFSAATTAVTGEV